MPPPEVAYVTTAVEQVPLTYEFVGVTSASRQVEVRARVKGFLDKRLFTEGSPVKEGDLLYTIDARQFAADVKVAEARLDQAKAGVGVAEASLAEARASLALNQKEYERYLALRDTGAVSDVDLDRVSKDLDAAKAAEASAAARVAEALATQRLAQADLENAQLELSYTEIRAPMSGIVGKAHKESGSLVDDGDKGLLTEITVLSPIYVSVNISEPQYLDWKAKGNSGEIVLPDPKKEAVNVVLQNGAAFPEVGHVNFESPAFDTATGTFELRAEFANQDRILRPGQFLKVRYSGWERPATIAVPQRAVNQMPSGAYVYVIDKEDKIEFRPVKLGQWTGSAWVITEGLAAGERVLVEGFMKVRPGVVTKPVAFNPEGSAPAPGAPAPAAKE